MFIGYRAFVSFLLLAFLAPCFSVEAQDKHQEFQIKKLQTRPGFSKKEQFLKSASKLSKKTKKRPFGYERRQQKAKARTRFYGPVVRGEDKQNPNVNEVTQTSETMVMSPRPSFAKEKRDAIAKEINRTSTSYLLHSSQVNKAKLRGGNLSTQRPKLNKNSSHVVEGFDDYYEPNDYMSSAYDLSFDEGSWLSSIEGYGYQCDDDYYEIYVYPGYEHVTVDLRFIDAEGDIDVKLLNQYGSTVGSSTGTSDDEYIDVDVNGPGTYYIQVYYDDECNEYDMYWETEWTGATTDDNYESNDSRGSAYDLTDYENEWLSDIDGLGVSLNDDWYEIYTYAGYQRVIADLRFEHDYGDLELALYDSNGNLLRSSTSSNDDEYIDFTVNAPGYYYLKIYDAGFEDGNTYDLLWRADAGGTVPDDYYEPNDSRWDSYSLVSREGDWLSDIHGYGVQSDDDYYEIRVESGYQRLNVDLLFEDDYGDIDLEVINSSGSVVASSRGIQDDEYIDVVLNPGTYYLRVYHANNGNEYDMSWWTESTQPAEDEYESNNTASSAYDLTSHENQWLSNIHGRGTQRDDDWYWMTIRPNYLDVTVELSLTNSSGNIDLELYKLNSNGSTTLVGSSRTFSNFESVHMLVSQPGNYAIRVYGANASNVYDLRWHSDFSRVNNSIPQAPASLNATADDAVAYLDWSWSDSSYDPQYNNVDQYRFEIRRRVVGTSSWSSIITNLSIEQLFYDDSNVTHDTIYEYQVRATNRNGSSSWSSSAQVTIVDNQTLNAPTKLIAFASGQNQVTLNWKDNSNNERGFEVWRKGPGQSNFSLIATAPSQSGGESGVASRSYVNTGVGPGLYTYKVRAVRTTTQSEYTNESQAQILAAGSPCSSADPGTLCLLQDRYEVRATWRDTHNQPGNTGVGTRITTQASSQESGFFWFFNSSNVELVVKVIEASLNPNFDSNWVFFGALSDVEYWVTVREVQTGRVKTYHNTSGNICGNADISAFPQTGSNSQGSTIENMLSSYSLPVAPKVMSRMSSRGHNTVVQSSVCAPSAETLCLQNGRFSVRVNWDATAYNAHPPTGTGKAVTFSQESGFFWFFSPTNTELVVKIIDGSAINSNYWVYFGALSTVQYDVIVTDNQTGQQRTYHNNTGNICGQADVGAFPH